jgi:hypothetical protein
LFSVLQSIAQTAPIHPSMQVPKQTDHGLQYGYDHVYNEMQGMKQEEGTLRLIDKKSQQQVCLMFRYISLFIIIF